MAVASLSAMVVAAASKVNWRNDHIAGYVWPWWKVCVWLRRAGYCRIVMQPLHLKKVDSERRDVVSTLALACLEVAPSDGRIIGS